MPVKIVSLEGNIGSGKSTLLTKLQEHFKKNERIVFLQEPVSEWESIQDKNGKTMLQKFYEDQDKYSFSFQMMAYISRLALLKKTAKENPDAIIITERSLDTDKYVFAKMLFDDGKIEDVNYAIYLKWFDHFIEDLPLEGVIYLKTDAEICSQRIRQRNRDGEETIPIEYLKKCGYYHNQMMFQKSGTLQITLNGNENIKYKLEEWISIVENYIQRL